MPDTKSQYLPQTEDTITSPPLREGDWCLRCDQPWDDLCQNYKPDCFYHYFGGDYSQTVYTDQILHYFKELDRLYEEEYEDCMEEEYEEYMEEDNNPEEMLLPVATRLGIQEEAMELIRDIGASDPFFGDVVPDPDPEDVETYTEITNQRNEEFTEQRRKDMEVAESFVAAFEAWAYDDPEIGVAHLEEEEYHMKPWSFESQEVHSNGNYMELEPEYISTDKADYLNLVLEPDDAILVRYALLESAMYLEDQVWEAEQREDKVIPELLKRGKHTLEIIADMIEAWLESL